MAMRTVKLETDELSHFGSRIGILEYQISRLERFTYSHGEDKGINGMLSTNATPSEQLY